MNRQIKPSEARPGDIITSVLTTEPTIREVDARPGSSLVKITFLDGGVLNTYDRFLISVIRSEEANDYE